MLTCLIKRPFVALLLILCVSLSSGCGYNLRGVTQVPSNLQTLILDSNDPYGPLARAVDSTLRSNGIHIEEDKTRTDIPTLRIIHSSIDSETASIFRNGIKAANQISLTINAQVLIPNRTIYPINILIQRTFIDNPLNALAKDSEQDIIKAEMYQQAAEQVIRKLSAANNAPMGPDNHKTH